MKGDDRTRFCDRCRLNVFNISEMTRAEAIDLVRRREGRLCVGFYRRPDGTVLTRDCPAGRSRMARRFALATVAGLTVLVAATSAFDGPALHVTRWLGSLSEAIRSFVDPRGPFIYGAF